MLVGDALGVPYEFHSPQAIPPSSQVEYDPPHGFQRAHAGVPPGTWSDDGAQALVLLASLLHAGRFDRRDFEDGLVAWYDSGYMAVDGRVFDVGNQTLLAIRRIKAGRPLTEQDFADPYTNGNGSLMRVLPLALWHTGSDEQLAADAQAQSCSTHGHLRSQVCCALYCLWARRILDEAGDAWKDAASTLRKIYGKGTDAYAELEEEVLPDDPPAGQGSGYVVDCLHSARRAMEAGSYEQVVKAAIALGQDTDTTACVAGGLAGVRDGIDAIPTRWREQLRGKEISQPVIAALLDWRS